MKRTLTEVEKKVLKLLNSKEDIKFKVEDNESLVEFPISPDIDGRGAVLVVCENSETKMIARMTNKQLYEVILSLISSLAEEMNMDDIALAEQICSEFEEEPVEQIVCVRGKRSSNLN